MFGGKQKIIEALIASHEAEREAWIAERRSLLNRIQAPETARYEDPGEFSEVPLYVPDEDPGAFDDYEQDRMAGEAI